MLAVIRTFKTQSLGSGSQDAATLSAYSLRLQPTGKLTFVSGAFPLGVTAKTYRISPLYAVPKKKPSKRRTRIRKTAWMKRYPLNWKRPMMLDIFDVAKYTDGTLTKARTTHQSWLNLPNTSLEGDHFLTREIRRSW